MPAVDTCNLLRTWTPQAGVGVDVGGAAKVLQVNLDCGVGHDAQTLVLPQLRCRKAGGRFMMPG